VDYLPTGSVEEYDDSDEESEVVDDDPIDDNDPVHQHNEPALPLEEIQAVPGHYRIKKRQLGIEEDDEQTVAKFITSSSPKRLKVNKNKNNNLSNQILPSDCNNQSSNQQRIRFVDAESKLSKVDELKT
jgi:hypothetical protein